ncbi:MAG: tryptophan synthase subunit alpha [Spirochaetes bacterium]|nr:tryptophan synthase subunit alpha [Spirochaetota bacterium]
MIQSKNRKYLMTHIVIGYPSLDANLRAVKTMRDAGVDYIEMQIPFSDPIADGKTILNANQAALRNKITVADCFRFAGKIIRAYSDISFLFMTYYNIVFNAGTAGFIKRSKNAGIYGLIVPDVPPEEDRENYFGICGENGIHPITVFSPTTADARLRNIKKLSSGFAYCTSRVGITGAGSKPHEKLGKFIINAKKIIDLPIAVGFGIDSASKAKLISEFADIIIIGSKVISIIDESGNKFEKNVYKFLYGVKKAIS